MIDELHVRNVGIVDELTVPFGTGMTAITGETGAGKTLIVTALSLLVGGRADSAVVRDGAEEALVEGRFLRGDEEIVLARSVPRQGRSRAYVNGRLATAADLAELGRELVDLHGQHAHQSLLATDEQRRTLDHFTGAAALSALEQIREARADVRRIDEELEALGGDPRARAREIELLRFQVAEIEDAAIGSPDEDDALDRRETLLAAADAYRDELGRAHELLAGTVVDALGEAVAGLARVEPLDALERAARELQAGAADLASEVREGFESIETDAEQLETVRARRALLRELKRKYGDGLGEVLSFADRARSRLTELESYAATVEARTAARAERERVAIAAARELSRLRKKAAPTFAEAVGDRLRALAMPAARVEVAIEPIELGDAGSDRVELLLAANRGESARPLAKAASGGELSRTMLAVRVVLSEAPPTLVFDEVDAGVGGEAGRAVGDALSELGRRHQVLVVTHLPQVAACADAQIVVRKGAQQRRTVADARVVQGDDRVAELARMLAGAGASENAREHARELLASSKSRRGVS